MDVRLTGTSGLLAGSRGWRGLGMQHRLDFGFHADWADALTDPDEHRALVLVVLLDDLGPGEDEALLAALDQRLSHTLPIPTLVAFASADHAPVLAAGRRALPQRAAAQHFERALYDRAATHQALYILPIDELVAELGRARFFDRRNYYAARARLSAAGAGRLAEAIGEMLERTVVPRRKLLVLDCDNTLWGGVIGEDGLEGVRLGEDGIGAAFQDFQRALKRLTATGLLLAIASKNNEADVWHMIDQHRGMVLSRADFVATRIDWADKPTNVKAIADALGLGLDSVAFWDDNPLERAEMRAAFAEIWVPDLPDEVVEWPYLLVHAAPLAGFEVTDEDRAKAAQYQARSAFTEEAAGAVDRMGFLGSIGLRAEAVPIDESTVARAAQLAAKTNQFNLRTIRHSAAALLTIAAEPGTVAFLGALKDRFGDHGIVGLIIIRPSSEDTAEIDTLLLSCRVLGRYLEDWMLAEAVGRLKRQGVRRLRAAYVRTGKNGMMASFLPDHGFQLDETGSFEADCEMISCPGAALYALSPPV